MEKWTRGREEGSILVLTVMILALLVSIVVEFAYGVFVSTNALYNYRDAQRLVILAESGTRLSTDYLGDHLSKRKYSTLDAFQLPMPRLDDHGEDGLMISIDDENARFNMNTIIYPNGLTNEKAFNTFKRLLKELSLNEEIVYRVADWIDPDGEESISDGEINAKNGYLYSKDELLFIEGIKEREFKKLLPYVTVYGNGMININTALFPILQSLSDDLNETLANRIIDYRDYTPFEVTTDVLKVAGLEKIGAGLLGRITVKSNVYSIRSNASFRGLSKTIESMVEMKGKKGLIQYWKES